MTFNQFVWKMAKVNKRKYIFYLLCNSFSVMVFFMFSTLYFNEKIIEAREFEVGFSDFLNIPITALIVFTLFFISYAHSIFIRRRNKEFGLFMTLGMSYKDISKLLLLENAIIAILSVVLGVLSGAIFSRLFFLILMNLIEMPNIAFHLNANMFLYSVGIFLFVFIVAIGKTLWVTKDHEIVQILKEERNSEKNLLSSPYLGGLGLLLIVFSVLLMYFYLFEEGIQVDDTKLLLSGTGVLFLGLYLSISQLGSFALKLFRRFPRFYYKRLLPLTNLEYKFKQLKGILLLITIMATVTIIFSTFALRDYLGAEPYVEEDFPYDVAFVQSETKNNIMLEEIYRLLDTSEHAITTYDMLEIYDYHEPHPYDNNGFSTFSFISVEDYNKISSTPLQVLEDSYIYFINADSKFQYTNSWIFEDKITIETEEKKHRFSFQERVVERVFNNLNFFDVSFIIVNQSDIDWIKKLEDVYSYHVHLINVSDWKEIIDAVYELKEKMNNYNQGTPPLDIRQYKHRIEVTDEELLILSSKIEQYNLMKKPGGLVFFVIIFLCVLFFFATFILLYLSLFTNIEQEKEKFQKLHKIGITSKEIKRIMSKELQFIFFVAPIMGCGLAYLYIYIFAKEIGGVPTYILINFLSLSSFYLLIQMIYYLVARKKLLGVLMTK